MISVKEAANKAFDFIKDLVPDPTEALVEEVEIDESKNFWFITISFLAKKINYPHHLLLLYQH